MEQPLPANGSCNLSSINLSEYVENPFTRSAFFNFGKLYNDIPIIVRAMDDVLEENISNHPLNEQREMAKKYRNIGIGIMGLTDMLVKLNMSYSSGISIVKEIISVLFANSLISSAKLGKERGNFPGYSSNVWKSNIIKTSINEDTLNKLIKNGHLRNCSLLSIAPTGSIATMLNVSTGVEPFFMLSYDRKTVSLNKDKETHYHIDIDCLKQYKEITGSNDIPSTFTNSVSQNINYKDRIKMQAILQNYVDTAISSTINLPKTTTSEDIRNIYIEAWKNGLKGITVYVEGSRDPILSKDGENKNNNSQCFNCITPISRKTLGTTIGSTFCKKCACGTMYITCNKDSKGNFVEVFTHTSKGGVCQANLNAVTRQISLGLRSGIKVNEVIDQLKGIHCPACATIKAKKGEIDGMSCPDIISKVMQEFTSNEIKNEVKENKCPECGAELTHEGGCVTCTSCGYSKCG